jgi:hypothetical protein
MNAETAAVHDGYTQQPVNPINDYPVNNYEYIVDDQKCIYVTNQNDQYNYKFYQSVDGNNYLFKYPTPQQLAKKNENKAHCYLKNKLIRMEQNDIQKNTTNANNNPQKVINHVIDVEAVENQRKDSTKEMLFYQDKLNDLLFVDKSKLSSPYLKSQPTEQTEISSQSDQENEIINKLYEDEILVNVPFDNLLPPKDNGNDDDVNQEYHLGR